MDFTKLPTIFTDKLIQCFNSRTIKLLRETTIFFKQMVDERSNKTSLIRQSKAVFNFDKYSSDSFEMFCNYASRSKINMIEFKQFRYCNDRQMEKIKTIINKNVETLIISNLYTSFAHVRALFQSINVEEVVFKNCKKILINNESANQLSKRYELLHDFMVAFNASCLRFIGCSLGFTKDFLESYLILPKTRKIIIERDDRDQIWNYYDLNCSCLSMKVIDKQKDFIVESKILEFDCDMNF
jgi:hypothetical protein